MMFDEILLDDLDDELTQQEINNMVNRTVEKNKQ
tara:strand:- start:683 stop:784 length:102 start_codon:yes stop_codon:yes gene_type:complete